MTIEIERLAFAMWQAMDANEKAGVRFGLFPAERMRAAEKAGWSPRELAVALMDVAKRNGGMVS